MHTNQTFNIGLPGGNGQANAHIFKDGSPCTFGTNNGNPMFHEKNRLDTFYDNGFTIWPKQQSITAEEVANSGFYYLGEIDRVACPWCNLILRDWSTGDSGMAEHKRHSAQCEFILQPDMCGNVLINPNARPVVPRVSTSGPKHARFADYQTRVNTFVGWPSTKAQRPEGLAATGLFYTGRDDNVRCFNCDIGLREWADEDDPWSEHARWSPNCAFVLEKKGRYFVEQVKYGALPNQVPHAPTQHPGGAGSPPTMADDRMDTPVVKVVLEMGYDRDLVRKVIEQNLMTTGDDFKNATSLIDAVIDYESKGGDLLAGSSNKPESSTSPATSDILSTPAKSSNESSDVTSLKEEIERLKDQQICKICMEESVAIVFLPCGHICACIACADLVKTCPICRLAIKNRVRAFLP